MDQRPRVELQVLDPRLAQEFGLPNYATPGSAGMDLRAMLDGPLTLQSGDTAMVGTGLAAHIADPGLAGIILPRSGLGHRDGLVLGNLVGLIDADYQGEIRLSLWNRSGQSYTVEHGQRVAQLVIMPVVQVQWLVVEGFEQSQRGEGGFGHSGHH